AVVWAHNSHLGDARATSMGQSRDEINLGQLCRENFGKEHVAIIGCGTHTGTVAAADEWDEPMKVMKVSPSREDSYEGVMHGTAQVSGFFDVMLDLRKGIMDEQALQALAQPRLERFIGVIYRPDTERWSHYMEAVLPEQYDAFLWFEKTRAVRPLDGRQQPNEAKSVEETFPSGL
ncbi:hypothetical protein LTS18_009228, partial [Coniosporium uncinatum]